MMMPAWLPFWSFYTVQKGPEQLSVIAPPEILWFVLITFGFWLVFLKNVRRGLQNGTTTMRGLGVIAILYLVILGVISGHGSMTLDKSTNTATIHRVGLFFIPHTTTIPLDSVARAELKSTSGANHLLLVAKDRSTYSIDYWTQMGGQQQSADKINNFLGVAP